MRSPSIPDVDWQKLGHTTSHYAWAFLAGALPGLYVLGLYGIAAGWITVVPVYLLRSRFYDAEDRFDPSREQALLLISAALSWILWYVGPLLWLFGWSDRYFEWEDVEEITVDAAEP